jgi:hypothetical protein
MRQYVGQFSTPIHKKATAQFLSDLRDRQCTSKWRRDPIEVHDPRHRSQLQLSERGRDLLPQIEVVKPNDPLLIQNLI